MGVPWYLLGLPDSSYISLGVPPLWESQVLYSLGLPKPRDSHLIHWDSQPYMYLNYYSLGLPRMRDSHLVLGLPSIYVPKSLFPGTPQEEGLPWFWDSQVYMYLNFKCACQQQKPSLIL
ncbi:uncharacterized protein LACBIDRAFT_304376 [Laccaria bicolor S238N-H82]|uniref:Predicted protein n=1 Tax=Laccaria bicolor (strain S238N-H82 / ATCC MYA-4686) TaxID=486041 RepID=B0DLH9_LACBS|nr:uncharacterized protein LACBIDRAFT_304376 [Laccaria bicolor S238N-H82]EDR04571.1 predicted protein [Laccaria bicolor S238N-H82]|eukprot:XP_001884743.1 predicted protein [Laccaria bicolor S238N-H82]